MENIFPMLFLSQLFFVYNKPFYLMWFLLYLLYIWFDLKYLAIYLSLYIFCVKEWPRGKSADHQSLLPQAQRDT